MSQINLPVIKDSIKLGNIISESHDHIMVEYDAEEVKLKGDDMLNELTSIISLGMDVDFFDNEGKYYLDSFDIIRARIGVRQ